MCRKLSLPARELHENSHTPLRQQFLCFLSAHRLFTKNHTKQKKAFPLDSVAQGFDPGDTLPTKLQAHVTHIYLWLSCQGKYWYHMQSPSWVQGNSKLLLQQDWKDSNSQMWDIHSGFGRAPELCGAGTVTEVPSVPCASSQQPHKSVNYP